MPERFLRTLTLSGLACWTAPVGAEPAIGQFELKTLESAPGLIEVQSQNAYSSAFS